jgi:iron complex outermembrane recepter protein
MPQLIAPNTCGGVFDANMRATPSTYAAAATSIVILLGVAPRAMAQNPALPPATGSASTAAQTAPIAAGGAEAVMERVIVTGSNIPTAEEVGPHPVDTYRQVDITRLGVRSSTDLIQKLPAATGAALNENNVNGGDGRTEVNLRGILAKETLVLQDGRRLAPVGFAGNTVDLNTIPIGLIDHIDILKDGASAVYGADAVAGVFNVWLIHRFRGLEIYASTGNTNLGFAGDSAEERGYLLAGTGDDKTDIVVYAEFYNRAAIYARDIDISHDADFNEFGGGNARSGFFAGKVHQSVYQPSLNGGSRTPTPHAYPSPETDPEYVSRFSLPRNEQGFNYLALTPALPSVDREYLYGSVNRKICDQYLEVFADFKYVRTAWSSGLAPAPFSPDPFTDATHPFGISFAGISVPTQNAFSPFTTAQYTSAGGFDPRFPETQQSAPPPGTGFTQLVGYRALEFGLRTDKITTNNYEFTGGLKGNLSEFGSYFKTWDWETGFRYNEDNRVERFGGIANSTALRQALLDTNPATAFNPFGIHQNSRAALNRVFFTSNHIGGTSLTLEDLKLTGDLFNVPAGPVSFAVGGEHRTEHADDRPDALTASNQTLGAVNFAPTTGSRDVWSAYWEVRFPVTSPTWNFPGLHSLELDYQERLEVFSDFGSTERPKIAVRWQPIDSALTIRASYSEAYHAPTLSDLFGGVSQSFNEIRDPRSPATEDQVETLLSGNPNLQPETAYEWTYGAVLTPGKWWSPLQGLTLQADFYHIDLRAVTVVLDTQFLVNHEDQFPGQVIRGESTGPDDPFGPIILLLTPQQNLGRMIEEGWDYEAVYAFETSRLGHGDWGTLTTTLNGTYIDRVVLQAVVGGPEQVVVGKFGGGFLGTGGGGSFTHNRWYASLFYDGPQNSALRGLDTGLSVHYIGQYWDSRLATAPVSFTDEGAPRFSDRKIREWITLDWILSYTFNYSEPTAQSEVPGYSKNGGNVSMQGGKEKNVMPASTAEYNPCGWRAWLNNTTVTLGLNNVLDEQPPFVAGSFENGYDESTANIKGRTWYVAVKKRF